MGKIDLGSHQSLSGRVGKLVYSKTKNGTTVREYVKPSAELSESQKKENEKFKLIKRAWLKMNDKARDRFICNLEALRLKSKHSGKPIKDICHFFTSLNLNLLSVNEAVKSDINSYDQPQLFTDVRFEITEENEKPDIKLYLSEEIMWHTKIAIYATRSVSVGKWVFANHDFRQIGVIDSSFKSGDSLTDAYLATYKTLPEKGKKIAIRIKPVNIRCGLADTMKEYKVIFKCAGFERDAI